MLSKLVIVGAGSAMFAKELIGDFLTFDDIEFDTIALVDIDEEKLETMDQLAQRMVDEQGKKTEIVSTTDRKEVLEGADYVTNTIGVGGPEAYQKDLEIPDKYGVNQNVGDTIGPGGTFRGMRVIPVMIDICKDMEKLCPEAILFNYTNPMAAACMAIDQETDIETYGLCHSVQGTARQIANYIQVPFESVSYWCAGINHMAWYLKYEVDGEDVYPKLKDIPTDQEVMDMLSEYEEDYSEGLGVEVIETVRMKVMEHFDYFVTESPFHMSEYVPYFRKNMEQIKDLHVHKRWWLTHEQTSDEYFGELRELLDNEEPIPIEKSYEYCPDLVRAMETGVPFRANLNVPNTNLITNLPYRCCVEVPCYADSTGIHPCHVGDLPEQLAGLNRTNVNIQEMMVKASLEEDEEEKLNYAKQAVALDPLTSGLLNLEEISDMVEEMFEVNRK